MSHRILTSLLLLAAGAAARADQILYQYEGNVLPYDPSAGWLIANPCEGPCSESMQSGQFVLNWNQSGDLANYDYELAQPPTDPPPPPFWVEWRFRSTAPKPPQFPSGDGRFSIRYLSVSEVVYLWGNAAVSFEGGDSIAGLELNEFHTFRFETQDGLNYTVSADGKIFIADACPWCSDTYHYFQFSGDGGRTHPTTNAWDYVRWGQIATGESIVSTTPPQGFLDPDQYAGTDRFTITLNEPGYVHIDDIAVTASGGDPPIVKKTWRRDGLTPKQIEVVLDRPLAVGETTAFTFAGLNPTANTVGYTLADPVPATSAWSVAACLVAIVIAGTVLVRRTADNSRRCVDGAAPVSRAKA